MKINIMNVGGCKPQYTTRLHRRLSFALRSNKCSDLWICAWQIAAVPAPKRMKLTDGIS